MNLLASLLVLAQVAVPEPPAGPPPTWLEQPAPGLAFAHGNTRGEGGITSIRWRGRELFENRVLDPDDHTSGLRVLGRWAKDGLKRWVFVAPGIDDCSAYVVWVLDLKAGVADLRRADRDCYQGQPSILRWTPRAQALVPRSKGFSNWWAAVDLEPRAAAAGAQ